jgi:hypothetical protein
MAQLNTFGKALAATGDVRSERRVGVLINLRRILRRPR